MPCTVGLGQEPHGRHRNITSHYQSRLGTGDLREGLRVDKQSRERDTENVLEFQGRRQLHY